MTPENSSVLDCCVQYSWATQSEITAYMPQAWRDYLGTPGSLPDGGGTIPILPMTTLLNPDGDRRADAVGPEGQPAGTDPDVLVDQLLDRNQLGGALLCHDQGGMAPLLLNHRLGAEVARAANDWTIDRWLSRDPRLCAAILVQNQVAEMAAAEIRRAGEHPQMVAVLMKANGLGKPFGHPAYREIFRAAAEMDLPVIIHSGGENTPDSIVPSAAHGATNLYSVYHALLDQAPLTHVTSLIAQGVFDELPSLRVLVAGAGVSWFGPHMIRFEMEYLAFRREAPWLAKNPSAYLRDHVRITTHPLEQVTDVEAWLNYITAVPELEDVLVYGSGYPSWDASSPGDVLRMIPSSWESKVLHDNARGFFDWPAAPDRVRPEPTEVR